MANDIQIVLHMPFAGPTVPETLYKVVTMAITPRTGEEILIAGRYMPVGLVRHRDNSRVELHISEPYWLLNWVLVEYGMSLEAAEIVAASLQTDDTFTDTSPWDEPAA